MYIFFFNNHCNEPDLETRSGFGDGKSVVRCYVANPDRLTSAWNEAVSLMSPQTLLITGLSFLGGWKATFSLFLLDLLVD